MENTHTSEQMHCLNCGTPVTEAFCQHCGQRVRDNADRSLSRLLGEVLSNVLFLDNRFLLSIWYLVRYPSLMTIEFLSGKRKKFISPITLFLFLNLVYFFVSPLTDYSLSLYDQLYSQPYSTWIRAWLDLDLPAQGLDATAYGVAYQNMSDNISKSVMILNIPLIAAIVYLMAFRRRRFYFDSLIFSFHFFSLHMVSWVMLEWMGTLADWITGDPNSILSSIVFNLFILVVPLTYAILGIKKFLALKWYWSIPTGIGVMAAVLLANMIYRLIIFLLTIGSISPTV